MRRERRRGGEGGEEEKQEEESRKRFLKRGVFEIVDILSYVKLNFKLELFPFILHKNLF